MARPPIGISILGFFSLVAGIAELLLGLNLMGIVTFGPVSSGNGVWFSGLLAALVGVLYIGLAFAAWSLRPWAWIFGLIMAVFGLFTAFFVTLASGTLAAGLEAAVLPALVLWYLNSDTVKKAFLDSNVDVGGWDYDASEAERITAERSEPA